MEITVSWRWKSLPDPDKLFKVIDKMQARLEKSTHGRTKYLKSEFMEMTTSIQGQEYDFPEISLYDDPATMEPVFSFPGLFPEEDGVNIPADDWNTCTLPDQFTYRVVERLLAIARRGLPELEIADVAVPSDAGK